jgi:hypothetical protein
MGRVNINLIQKERWQIRIPTVCEGVEWIELNWIRTQVTERRMLRNEPELRRNCAAVGCSTALHQDMPGESNKTTKLFKQYFRLLVNCLETF